jgi:hypothetical protein
MLGAHATVCFSACPRQRLKFRTMSAVSNHPPHDHRPMTSETPSPTPPVLPLPNLPPPPPQLRPKSRRGRAHARAPPHDLRARYLSAQRSTRGTPSVEPRSMPLWQAGRTQGIHSLGLARSTYTTRRTSPPAYRRPPSTLRAALQAAQAVPPARRQAVLTNVQLADADRDPIS